MATLPNASLHNEVANICDRVGADVQQVALGMGLDSRIGGKFLQAGLGWGGSCFPNLAIEKLRQSLGILKGKTIGLLGLVLPSSPIPTICATPRPWIWPPSAGDWGLG
jgi:UDPglucose 6-dehydrogenase